MESRSLKPFICDREIETLSIASRVGRAVLALSPLRVEYRLDYQGRRLVGTGWLRSSQQDDRLSTRVIGEPFEASPVEVIFHRFHLSRRGMISLVARISQQMTPRDLPLVQQMILPSLPPREELLREVQRLFQRRTEKH
ncbi:hypothetical protein [Haloferula sp. A504]|uniref:hypothetical protein n=1 Tax=Haloferula sp. A504 TaxID=3373601 RepID=UPI0031BCCCFE|nr:hypothetical protein [Verrucomicrobiaceae bacterium E54]